MTRIELATRISAPIERVFDLSLDIDLHVRSMERSNERAVAGVTMGQIGLGQEVTWRARHFGLTWTMTSRIVELDRPSFFVDQQVEGPFRAFRHEHWFRSEPPATAMLDVVTFRAPIGSMTDLAIKPYLRHLIQRRNRFIAADSGAS
jgi:ligand-binding SRPBCC domain-containing protein